MKKIKHIINKIPKYTIAFAVCIFLFLAILFFGDPEDAEGGD